MGRLRYKGYIGSVEYSEKDKCFVGRALGMQRTCILYEGDSVETLQKDFEEGVDQYLAECASEGIQPEVPYSGKLVLRLTSKLHADAADKAKSLGMSLNEFIKQAITAAL